MNCNVGIEYVPDFSELEKGIDKDGNTLCPVHWTKECIRAARLHICGKTVACREGLTQMYLITQDITSGAGRARDLELLEQTASYVAEAGGCRTAEKAAANTLKSLELYREEWDNHCRRKRCACLKKLLLSDLLSGKMPGMYNMHGGMPRRCYLRRARTDLCGGRIPLSAMRQVYRGMPSRCQRQSRGDAP